MKKETKYKAYMIQKQKTHAHILKYNPNKNKKGKNQAKGIFLAALQQKNHH